MKKPHSSSLLLLTGLFLIFTLILFVVRNYPQDSVSLSATVENTRSFADNQSAAMHIHTENPFPIDINAANKETLMTLPGIGEVLAERILSYRQTHNGFTQIEDLLYVDGIGQTRFEELIDWITVGG